MNILYHKCLKKRDGIYEIKVFEMYLIACLNREEEIAISVFPYNISSSIWIGLFAYKRGH